MIDYTKKIVKGLGVIGLINIQYVFDGERVLVIEVNPRASRTVPILSKVTGVPMVKLAVETMLGKKIKNMDYGTGLLENKGLYAVKVPVFSGEKLTDVDISLGPEMKSTGEVLGIDKDLNVAIYKGFLAAGMKIPVDGGVYVSLKNFDKTQNSLEIIQKYIDLGFKIYTSRGTYEFLTGNNISCTEIKPFEVQKHIYDGNIKVVINTPTRGGKTQSDAFKIRRKATEYRLPVLTSIETAAAFALAIRIKMSQPDLNYEPINTYLGAAYK